MTTATPKPFGTMVWFTQSHRRTPQDAADEFAREFFGRQANGKFRESIMVDTTGKFALTGGEATYQMLTVPPERGVRPGRYEIWRLGRTEGQS